MLSVPTRALLALFSFLTGSFRRRRLNIPQTSPPGMLTDEVPAVMGLNSPITEGVKKEFDQNFSNEIYNWNELTWNGTNVKRSVPRR